MLQPELKLRRDKIRWLMAQQGIDAALITCNVNLLYTYGRVVSGYLYLPLNAPARLFVKRPNNISGEHIFSVRKHSFHELEYDEFKALSYDAYSMIGHKDLANILGVKYNRENIKLNKDDVCFVAQVWGGRLPEGTTELPEGVELRFYCVKIIENLKIGE